MGDVTYSPFFSGTLLSPTDLYSRFYTWEGDSLEVINGRLDRRNVAIGFSVDYTALQPISTSGGGQVAGTANLDYFVGSRFVDGWFKDIYRLANASDPDGTILDPLVTDTLEFVDSTRYVPIPGSSIQFYLPYKAFVLLTWQVTWANDSGGPLHESHIQLFVDDYRPVRADASATSEAETATKHCNVRRVGQCRLGKTPTEDYIGLRDRYKGRYWSGHQWLDTLDTGWHSASLRVVSTGNEDYATSDKGPVIQDTRVRARSMKYIFFKRADD